MSYANPVLYIKGGGIDIRSDIKRDGNAALAATGAVAGHVGHARCAIHLGLNGGRGSLFNRLRVGAGKHPGDAHGGRRYIRVLRDGQYTH